MAVPYEFFDGEVTVSAADPWGISTFYAALAQNGQQEDGRVELAGNPLSVATGCEPGAAELTPTRWPKPSRPTPTCG